MKVKYKLKNCNTRFYSLKAGDTFRFLDCKNKIFMKVSNENVEDCEHKAFAINVENGDIIGFVDSHAIVQKVNSKLIVKKI